MTQPKSISEMAYAIADNASAELVQCEFQRDEAVYWIEADKLAACEVMNEAVMYLELRGLATVDRRGDNDVTVIFSEDA